MFYIYFTGAKDVASWLVSTVRLQCNLNIKGDYVIKTLDEKGKPPHWRILLYRLSNFFFHSQVRSVIVARA